MLHFRTHETEQSFLTSIPTFPSAFSECDAIPSIIVHVCMLSTRRQGVIVE